MTIVASPLGKGDIVLCVERSSYVKKLDIK